MRVEGTQSTGAGNMSDNVMVSNDTLGKQEFLELLITELRHQDPMQPMNDRELLTQLAQFSSLEEMVAVGKSIDSLVAAQEAANLANQVHLIGKQADVLEPDTGRIVSGTVSAVRMIDGNSHVIMNGLAYSLDQIVGLYT